jgi:hypothetical protein
MVRKGSSVRVRQRALTNCLRMGHFREASDRFGAGAGAAWKLFGSLVAKPGAPTCRRRRSASWAGARAWIHHLKKESFVIERSPARRSSGRALRLHGCHRKARALASRRPPWKSAITTVRDATKYPPDETLDSSLSPRTAIASTSSYARGRTILNRLAGRDSRCLMRPGVGRDELPMAWD